MEIWRVIPNTKNLYEVSNHARVRRTDKGTFLTPHLHNTGYHRVCLSVNGKPLPSYLHILVAQAFLGERPPKHDINHKNGVKTDNHINNLEYLDRKQHEQHTRFVLKRQRGSIGEQHGNATITEEIAKEIHRLYCTGQYKMKDLAKRFGISTTGISAILNGHSWKHLNLPKPPKRNYHLKGLENPKGKVSKEMTKQIKHLYAHGHAVSEITKQFQLGRTTVYRILRKR